jgi:hypothetical protein
MSSKAAEIKTPDETTTSKEKKQTPLQPDFCGKSIETNDYKLNIKCISPISHFKTGNVSKIKNKILVLTQNGFIHLLDGILEKYVWSIKLDLPHFDNEYEYSTGAKGVLWIDPKTFIVFYMSKNKDCFQPTLAEFTDLDLTQIKEIPQTLSPKKIVPIAECLSRASNPDFNGVGGSFLRTSKNSFLISVGAPEGFSAEIRRLAQSQTSHYGKILEFQKTDKTWLSHRGRIFSMGHRNPQGLTQFANGSIFSSEHGPKGGDEINVIRDGGNYG